MLLDEPITIQISHFLATSQCCCGRCLIRGSLSIIDSEDEIRRGSHVEVQVDQVILQALALDSSSSSLFNMITRTSKADLFCSPPAETNAILVLRIGVCLKELSEILRQDKTRCCSTS